MGCAIVDRREALKNGIEDNRWRYFNRPEYLRGFLSEEEGVSGGELDGLIQWAEDALKDENYVNCAGPDEDDAVDEVDPAEGEAFVDWVEATEHVDDPPVTPPNQDLWAWNTMLALVAGALLALITERLPG